MNDNKCVETLRFAADECDCTNFGCEWRQTLNKSADLIESLQSQLAESQKRYVAAVKFINWVDLEFGYCMPTEYGDRYRALVKEVQDEKGETK